jgi:hypothetical protein
MLAYALNPFGPIPRRHDLPCWLWRDYRDYYFNVGLYVGWAVGACVFLGTWVAAAVYFWILGVPFGWIPASAMGRMAFYVAAWTWGLVATVVVSLSCIGIYMMNFHQ